MGTQPPALPPDLLATCEAIQFRAATPAARTAAFAALAAAHPEHATQLAAWQAAVQAAAPAADGGQPPELPDYRLVGKLGEGGFGEVWRAQQVRPVLRDVALKLLKRGMDSAAILRRFAREQEALARMNHDAIAKIHDAGTTADGQPFFAMELVEGEPITDFCDRWRLPLAARLRLLLGVCRGVHHAHQKGVVHRDLKPSNILVAGTAAAPQPKLIDFGIARALEPEAASLALTETGMMLGTPAYMAPEQAAGDLAAIDTRTDVYALGALLFELLTGETLLQGQVPTAATPWQVRRQLLEGETPRPSGRVRRDAATVALRAAARSISAATWERALRQDLDWIVLKATAKEPEQRYGSAADLAADLERHLQQEPVLAGPPSASYRLRKFVRRHRLQVGAALAVVVTAVLGAVVSWRWAAVAEANAAVAADRAAEIARRIAEFERLAGVVQLEQARVAARQLQPPWPEQIPALRAWLAQRSEPLRQLRPGLASALADLASRSRPLTAAESDAARGRDPRWPKLVELRARRDGLATAVAQGERALPGATTAADSLADWQRSFVALFGRRPDPSAPVLDEGKLLAAALEQAQLQLATVERDEQQLASAIDAALVPHFDLPADQFLFTTLRRLLTELDEFDGREGAWVTARLQWAEQVDGLTRSHPRARVGWDQMREEFAAAGRLGSGSPYAGVRVELAPQTGLVPLGRNPKTGLFEFYDLLSAWDGVGLPSDLPIPEHAADGTIAVGPGTGIVFVLLPGGECSYGTQREDPQGPYYDPSAPPDQTVHRGQLQPFLLARHELTQGQWRRLSRYSGQVPEPSYYKTGTGIRLLRFDDRHPVEMVSHAEAEGLLQCCGLLLPSEVQWEYACRAGTTTPWWCAKAELVRCANVADRRLALAAGQAIGEAWDDRYSLHAPVGTFQANPFGLHDTHGNLAEWCSDESGQLGAALRATDGRRLYGDGSGMRVLRGGFFGVAAAQCGSGIRVQAAPSVQSSQYGVRPARPLQLVAPR
jgi:serine/threonine protein kinase/formylglycine-generating enzyme required for sulfatase activity